MVDENRIEGSARSMGGKIKEAFGNMTGDAKTQASGQADQAFGSAQDAMGAAMDAAGEWQEKIIAFTKDKPIVALLAAVSVGFVLRMVTVKPRR